jgi:hypothetical protein
MVAGTASMVAGTASMVAGTASMVVGTVLTVVGTGQEAGVRLLIYGNVSCILGSLRKYSAQNLSRKNRSHFI